MLNGQPVFSSDRVALLSTTAATAGTVAGSGSSNSSPSTSVAGESGRGNGCAPNTSTPNLRADAADVARDDDDTLAAAPVPSSSNGDAASERAALLRGDMREPS